MVEKECGTAIICLRTDRRGEFNSVEFKEYCKEQGIKRQLTAYSPQQNGVAERKNMTILNMVRSMLISKNVPKKYWPEAATWTTYLLNRSATLSVKDSTPEEAWSEKKPEVHHFRVFGSIVHAHVPRQKKKKINERSIKCVMFGVSEESKAYRLYDPKAKRIIISRDVVFEEDEEWEWKEDDGNKDGILHWDEE